MLALVENVAAAAPIGMEPWSVTWLAAEWHRTWEAASSDDVDANRRVAMRLEMIQGGLINTPSVSLAEAQLKIGVVVALSANTQADGFVVRFDESDAADIMESALHELARMTLN